MKYEPTKQNFQPPNNAAKFFSKIYVHHLYDLYLEYKKQR